MPIFQSFHSYMLALDMLQNTLGDALGSATTCCLMWSKLRLHAFDWAMHIDQELSQQLLHLHLHLQFVFSKLLLLSLHVGRQHVVNKDGHNEVEDANGDKHEYQYVPDEKLQAIVPTEAFMERCPVPRCAPIGETSEDGEHGTIHPLKFSLIVANQVLHNHTNEVDRPEEKNDCPEQDSHSAHHTVDHHLELVEKLEPQSANKASNPSQAEHLNQSVSTFSILAVGERQYEVCNGGCQAKQVEVVPIALAAMEVSVLAQEM
mmetsp:Transcript_53007/g.124199  ORF Transcript_53007/g.124199 Transcript_53007/m.124199 type:complete len:261 (-) Transcript_53007:1345-2127(-)